MLERSVRATLTSAANSSTAQPVVWGLIAQLNDALGYPDSARDAFKKQARLLTLLSLIVSSFLSHCTSSTVLASA
jgi:hypothetical protein